MRRDAWQGVLRASGSASGETMRLDAALDVLGAMPFFDLATVVQLTQESRASLVEQLHRWCRAGKLVPLRRGMYTFADRYRRVAMWPAALVLWLRKLKQDLHLAGFDSTVRWMDRTPVQVAWIRTPFSMAEAGLSGHQVARGCLTGWIPSAAGRRMGV